MKLGPDKKKKGKKNEKDKKKKKHIKSKNNTLCTHANISYKM